METTIETHEVWVVTRPVSATRQWCVQCSAPAPMYAPEEAAALLVVSPRTIYRWVEAGCIHFRETSDEGILVCSASLLPFGLKLVATDSG